MTMIVALSWITLVTLASSVAGVITAAAALIAFVFLRRQQSQTERQIIGTTSRYMYEEMSKLLAILVEKPELRPFIYDGKTLDAASGELQRQQVLALAGLYCDLFEQLLYQLDFGNLSITEYEKTWQMFIESLLHSSSVLRSFAVNNAPFYLDDFVALARAAEPPLSELEHATSDDHAD